MIFLLSLIIIVLIFIFYKKTVPQLDPVRKYLLIALRSISIIIVLILLLNPIIYFIRNRIFQPEFIVLRDISDSMNLRSGDVTKTELLADFHDQYTDKLKRNGFKLMKYDFAGGLSGDTGSTFLSKTLTELSDLKNFRDVKGFILLSDGWFKDDDLDIIQDMNIPVYSYIPQVDDKQFDLEITDFKYNRTAFRNEITPLVVNVFSQNYTGKARLELFLDDHLSLTQQIDFKVNNFQQLVLDHVFSDPGFIPIKVAIQADTIGEINTANNMISGAIQVVQNRNQVLILSDKLTWDTKFIVDALRGNERWKTEFLIKTNRLLQGNIPVRLQEKIQNISLLLIINNEKLSMDPSEKEIISNYVNNGGGVILLGKLDAFLQSISPVMMTEKLSRDQGVLYFTETSKQYQSFDFIDKSSLRNIPPLDFYHIKPKAQTQVLAGIENEDRSPVILYSDWGESKILYLAFTGFWKWQLWDSAGTYSKFISDICMWIGQKDSERFSAFAEKTSYDPGEIVKIRLQAYDEKLIPLTDLNVIVNIFNASGKLVFEGYMIETDNEYTVMINDLEPGSYTFRLTEDDLGQSSEDNFFVSENKPESRDQGFNSALLNYIAGKTDGKAYRSISENNFIIPDNNSRTQLIRLELPVYKKWYIITIFLLCFCLELFLRKRWGLL